MSIEQLESAPFPDTEGSHPSFDHEKNIVNDILNTLDSTTHVLSLGVKEAVSHLLIWNNELQAKCNEFISNRDYTGLREEINYYIMNMAHPEKKINTGKAV